MSYTSQIALAQRLITKKGMTRVLVHFPVGAPVRDRVTGAISNDQSGEFSVQIVVLPLKASRANGEAGHVEKRQRKFLISGTSCPVLPQTPDQVLNIEGINWTVLSCQPLSPDDGNAIIYTGVLEA